MIVLSIAFLVRTVVRADVELARFAAAEAAQTHWPTPGLAHGGMLGYVALLMPLGYALATALFFTALGARAGQHRARCATRSSGVVLGVVVGYAFTRWLGVRLPVGPWGV